LSDPIAPVGDASSESVAAAEIHKAGQHGADAARYLFWSLGLGALVQSLGTLQLFATDKNFIVRIGEIGKSFVRLGAAGSTNILQTGAVSTLAAPTVSPALVGVGYPAQDEAGYSDGRADWEGDADERLCGPRTEVGVVLDSLVAGDDI